MATRTSPCITKRTRKGREPLPQTVHLLGMVLWYIRTSEVSYLLCPIFGLVSSSVSDWISYGIQLLRMGLTSDSILEAQISFPNLTKMERNAQCLRESKPKTAALLKGVLAESDCGRFACANCEEADLQNPYFNGYIEAKQVTNLFVWNFHGEIIHSAINYPGSWHDSRLAGVLGLYWPRLSDELTPPGFGILGYSAFCNNLRVTNGRFLRCRKASEKPPLKDKYVTDNVDVLLRNVHPCRRLTAEWGVNGLNAPFRRLKSVLPADIGKRFNIIPVPCHLMNLRTRMMRHNKIRTVYGGITW